MKINTRIKEEKYRIQTLTLKKYKNIIRINICKNINNSFR